MVQVVTFAQLCALVGTMGVLLTGEGGGGIAGK